MKHTFLRLSFYTENFFGVFPPRRGADGALALALPMADKPMSLFSVGDLGRAVVTVLSNTEAHNGKAYGLASDWLTGTEIVSLISSIIGEPVAYTPPPVEGFKKAGFPGAEDLGNMFDFYANHADKFVRSVEDTKALIPHLTTAAAVLATNPAALRGSA